MKASTQVWVATIPAVVLTGVGVYHLVRWIIVKKKPARATMQAPPPRTSRIPNQTAALAQRPQRKAASQPSQTRQPQTASARTPAAKARGKGRPKLNVIRGGKAAGAR
jgi:hypothetical protein